MENTKKLNAKNRNWPSGDCAKSVAEFYSVLFMLYKWQSICFHFNFHLEKDDKCVCIFEIISCDCARKETCSKQLVIFMVNKAVYFKRV